MNLTLIDLPGLTKVAVGNILTICLVQEFHTAGDMTDLLNFDLLQRDNKKVLSRTLRTWSAVMSKRYLNFTLVNAQFMRG